jgi:hypothetical protein
VDPPSEPKSVVVLVRYLRARVGDPRMKLPAREKDARAEVLARLVLMRFEPKEVNEENLDALVARLPGVDAATKAQARQALQPLGIRSRKLDDALGPPDDKGAPPK